MSVAELKKALAYLDDDAVIKLEIKNAQHGSTKTHVTLDEVLYVSDKEIWMIGNF